MNDKVNENLKKFKEQYSIDVFNSLMAYEKIFMIGKNNNGYITSREVTRKGISREYLRLLLEKEVIEKVSRGIYILKDVIPDDFYIFSLRYPKTIFSHMTALYFHNLSIKAPYNSYDITVSKSYHSANIKNCCIFYVDKNLYNLGLEEIKTPNGNMVKVYDVERCICDIIRSRKRMDIEHIKYSVKQYLKRKDKNLNKLSIYADKMGIKEEVMDFLSMMYE